MRFVSATVCLWITASLIVSAAPQSGSEARPARKDAGLVAPNYRIGVGDDLQISVWKEPDASIQAIQVRPDGKINMPFVKEIDVVGLTTTELETLLAERLKRFLKEVRESDITVMVRGVNSSKIYLVGAVKREGPIPLKTPMTIMQALIEGGGLTDFAKRKKIYVLRKGPDGKETKLPFNWDEALKGPSAHNVLVAPGDMIVVPR